MLIALSKGRFFPAIATLAIAGTLAVAAFKAVANDSCQFADVPKSSDSDVVYACQQGWFEGYPDGTFQPDRRIPQRQIATVINRVFPTGATRADMAAFLRGGNPGDPAGPAGFSDIPLAHPQHQDIAYAKERGWFTGYPNGNFRPEQSITPAQIVTVLQRAFPTGSTRADLASFMRNGNQALTTTTYQLSNNIGTWAWSPTRDEIAYTTTFQDAEGNELDELRVTTTDGAVTRKLYDTIHDIRDFSWSPEGNKIAYVVVVRDAKGEKLREGLLVVSTEGPSQSILTEPVTIKGLKWADATSMWIVDGAYPISYTVGSIIWSPRGDKIAFNVARQEGRGTGRIELWVAEIDGSNTPTIISEGAIYSLYLRIEWSPDGNHIAYTVNTHDEMMLWVTGADGSNTRQLSNNSSWEWSSSGDNIAYWVNSELWVTRADGSNTRQLFNDGYGSRVQWSPNGDQIAYTISVQNAQGDRKNKLLVATTDGSNTREISSQTEIGNLKWSPDGEHIAYIDNLSYDTGNLWIARLYPLNKQRISSNNRDGSLRWSPDSQRIAYTKLSAEHKYETWISKTDGSNTHKISNVQEWSGVWSPSSDQFAYTIGVRETPDNWRRELWVTGADGLNTRRLSNQLGYWIWSPSGDHIAYTTNGRDRQNNKRVELWITKVN